jgi:hypothetical protein
VLWESGVVAVNQNVHVWNESSRFSTSPHFCNDRPNFQFVHQLIQFIRIDAGLEAEGARLNAENFRRFGFWFSCQTLPQRFVHYLFEGGFTSRHSSLQFLRDIRIQGQRGTHNYIIGMGRVDVQAS